MVIVPTVGNDWTHVVAVCTVVRIAPLQYVVVATFVSRVLAFGHPPSSIVYEAALQTTFNETPISFL